MSGRYQSFAEREDIAIWRAQDVGVRGLARRLGRSASTISRELRRNASKVRAVGHRWPLSDILRTRCGQSTVDTGVDLKPRMWASTVLSGLPSSPAGVWARPSLLGREFLVANDIIRTVAISRRERRATCHDRARPYVLELLTPGRTGVGRSKRRQPAEPTQRSLQGWGSARAPLSRAQMDTQIRAGPSFHAQVTAGQRRGGAEVARHPSPPVADVSGYSRQAVTGQLPDFVFLLRLGTD